MLADRLGQAAATDGRIEALGRVVVELSGSSQISAEAAKRRELPCPGRWRHPIPSEISTQRLGVGPGILDDFGELGEIDPVTADGVGRSRRGEMVEKALNLLVEGMHAAIQGRLGRDFRPVEIWRNL